MQLLLEAPHGVFQPRADHGYIHRSSDRPIK